MTTASAADEFLRYRARLLGVAYRLLGSMWDAEDVVSEAMVRWLRVDQSEIREPLAYLTTMVSRIALDQLKSARVTRQAYIGPWLPEPALTASADLGPLDTVELRESVSVATLHVMEQLTPPERGVFVLREAFEFKFGEIAEMLDVSEASARQLYHRARERLADDDIKRFDADPEEHARLLERLLQAVGSGELEELEELLASDAVVYSDGGGKHRAALRAIVGRMNIIKFIRGVGRRASLREVKWVEANGVPAAIVTMADRTELFTVEVRDHRIKAIYGISNPDKLSYLDHQLANRA